MNKYKVFYAYTGNIAYTTTIDDCDVPFSVDLLPHTHAFVREVKAGSLDQVYHLMQGEVWSPAEHVPRGEARQLIASLGVGHTSLSVGDVVRDGEGMYWMCATAGWKQLPEALTPEQRQIVAQTLKDELSRLFQRGAPFSQTESRIGAKMLALQKRLEASNDA